MATQIIVKETMKIFPQCFEVFKGSNKIGTMRMEYNIFRVYFQSDPSKERTNQLIFTSNKYTGFADFEYEDEKMAALQIGVNLIVSTLNNQLHNTNKKKKIAKPIKNNSFVLESLD